jgi:glyoxylase-like metal-dependent hydrolase (beta-lactamase superfamily II)
MFFGDYHIKIAPDAEFWLDGGAMFGVVPRVLWEQISKPDALNRVRLNANCLFIETPAEKILIETGMGDKWTTRQREMFGINRTRSLSESLKEIAGVGPEEITIVVNTHLHFDHAGGNTQLNEEGRVVPSFPNARYFVSRSEFEQAENPHERARRSYLSENWQPLVQSGQLELKGDDYEVVSGLRMETVAGHSRTMQCVRLERAGKTLFGFADLVPTRAHIPFAWIMGYDLYPVETLEAKKRLLPRAAKENWVCWFYHDADESLVQLIEENGKLKSVRINEE